MLMEAKELSEIRNSMTDRQAGRDTALLFEMAFKIYQIH